MAEDVTIRVEGMEELQKTLEKLVKKYPDKADEVLKNNARKLRRRITKQMKSDTKTDSSNKYSLGKASSYKISRVSGFGINKTIDISAKAPHFHLVEHGHKKYDFHGNPTGGFVQGTHSLETATKKFEGEMPEVVESMVNSLLKEAGLL